MRCSIPTASRSAVAHRHADHHCRRRHDLQRERPARQDRRGAADRSDAARRPKATRCSAPMRRRAGRRRRRLVQGAIEDSNVQPVLEMTRMMDGLRQFQFVSQFIQAEGDRQQSAIDKLLPQQHAADAKNDRPMRSLDIAGTGMQAQQTNVEVISNNIANMTTTGFKRRRAEFQDLIYQNLRRVGSNSSDTGTIVPSGAQVGLGVQDRGDLPDQRAGQPAADLQHAGHGDPGQRLFPGHAAVGRHRLYARRHVRPGRRRHDRHGRRLYRAARGADPVERHRRDGQCVGPGAGDAARPDGAADRRVSCSSRCFPTRPGWMRRATTCSLQTAASGQPVDRQSRHRPASAR